MKNADYYVKISGRKKDRDSREDFLKTLTKLWCLSRETYAPQCRRY